MKTPGCKYVMAEFDEILDGPLDTEKAIAVQSHLEGCPSCRAEFEATRELIIGTRELPISVEPERDLWPEIADRIEDRRIVRGRFARHSWSTAGRFGAVAAAAAMLVAAVTIAYMAGLNQAQPRIADTRAIESPYQTVAFTDLETDLVRARDQLLASLQQRQDQLTPATWTVVMDNLEVIDNAIFRIETAIADNPDDVGLNRRLTVAYRRQIDLLQRANRLPAEI